MSDSEKDSVRHQPTPDVRLVEMRRRSIVPEPEELPVGQLLLERPIRALRDDPAELDGFLGRLPTWQRLNARLALIHVVGAERAREVVVRVFGAGQASLPSAPPAVAAPSKMSLEERLAHSQARALAEGVGRVLDDAAPDLELVGGVLSGFEPHIQRASLAYLRHRRRDATESAQSDPSALPAALPIRRGAGPLADARRGAALAGAIHRRAATIFRREVAAGDVDLDDPAVTQAIERAGHGEPLSEAVRLSMEARLGLDFRRVQIHTDAVAARAAEAMNADAFTIGDDLFFREGAFSPSTERGRRLLVHELMHVVQAHQGRVPTGQRRQLSEPTGPLEREAAAVADRVADPPSLPAKAGRNEGAIQAKQEPDAERHDSEEERARIRRAARRALDGSSGRLPFLDTIQKSFGRHDVSTVAAHTDGAAAEGAKSMGAEAFAQGSHVAFAGAPSLHTTAHEAAHVIQQRAGVEIAGGVGQESDRHERNADEVADRVVRGESAEALLDTYAGPVQARPGRVGREGPAAPPIAAASGTPAVQLRRIPANVQALLTATVGVGDGVNFAANAEGVERLIARAMAELTAAQRATVLAARRGPLTEAQFAALPRRDQLSRHANAIIALFPGLGLANPRLIDTGPRNAAETARLATAVTGADTVFAVIASAAQDANLDQVFGAANRAAARAKYANGRIAMNNLRASNHIVTSREPIPAFNYFREVSLGGLSDSTLIRVAVSVFDDPTNKESIITLMHESMHAGNFGDVTDNGYIDAPQFTTRDEAGKLTNAAHFEVVPRRILGASNSFPGVTFTPAGSVPVVIGGPPPPPVPLPTIPEQAARAASEMLRRAWTVGLNLHTLYVRLLTTPTDWTVSFAGANFNNSLPFWSKVEKLTIHNKATITPASADPAQHPVSEIDVALSEGLVRKLAAAMFLLDPLNAEADVLHFERSRSTTAERGGVFPSHVRNNVLTERDFLVRLALRDQTVAPLTGNAARDFRVAVQMGDSTLTTWPAILAARLPTDFLD